MKSIGGAFLLLFEMFIVEPAAALSTSPPQPVVIDSSGATVGALVSSGLALIYISGVGFFSTLVSREGFSTYTPTYFYKTSNCTGQRYLPADFVLNQAYVNENVIVYAAISEGATATFASAFDPGGGTCNKASRTFYGAPARTATVSSLQVTPPFSVVAK